MRWGDRCEGACETYLGCHDEGAEEDALVHVGVGGHAQMRLAPIDVGEEDEDDGGGDFSAGDHALHEFGEGDAILVAACRAAALHRGGAPEGEVNRVHSYVDDVVCRYG